MGLIAKLDRSLRPWHVAAANFAAIAWFAGVSIFGRVALPSAALAGSRLRTPGIQPIPISMDHITGITVCTRPFRANGPRQREALRDMATHWEDLPAGTFAESGTMVNTALLVIDN